eukprot:CAMPEP_0116881370 /NCGR_PEP_ID=MMETSP0463-20121206/13488_1 /TAXON_ID=181622 /ORGANISM="Strombidinopsis sp, Strain SopsisLIS2011" /LENGTH=44 /DNA_ID= /DNA_START= /DNA_END= /DNA_ORIENTATION=
MAAAGNALVDFSSLTASGSDSPYVGAENALIEYATVEDDENSGQ